MRNSQISNILLHTNDKGSHVAHELGMVAYEKNYSAGDTEAGGSGVSRQGYAMPQDPIYKHNLNLLWLTQVSCSHTLPSSAGLLAADNRLRICQAFFK